MARDSKEKERAYLRRRYSKNRVKILDILGGKCVNCGHSDYDVLQIDHIIPIKFPSGRRLSNMQMFFRILNGKLSPKELQILCANCHMKKTVMELRKKI